MKQLLAVRQFKISKFETGHSQAAYQRISAGGIHSGSKPDPMRNDDMKLFAVLPVRAELNML